MYDYERFAARPTLDIDFLEANISNDSDNIIKAFIEIGAVPYDEEMACPLTLIILQQKILLS